MKHRYFDDHNIHFARRHGRSEHVHGGRGRGGRFKNRLFDYGELRVLILAMISEQPRHGYDLIKTIEERFGGSYSPSPGVIYPTLAWLDDMGYAVIEPEAGGRKLYRISPEGAAFLDANRDAAEELLSRAGSARGGPGGVPAPVIRAMEGLKLALRLRLRAGPVDQAAAEKIAAALDTAAVVVERT